MINKMKENRLQCNTEKSFFGQTEMEYLGFGVTRNGAKSINRKIEPTTNIKPPNYQEEVRKFIGVINYYRDMRPRRSHKLSPLTRLTYIKWKFK